LEGQTGIALNFRFWPLCLQKIKKQLGLGLTFANRGGDEQDEDAAHAGPLKQNYGGREKILVESGLKV
jgi:hypothetical protein